MCVALCVGMWTRFRFSQMIFHYLSTIAIVMPFVVFVYLLWHCVKYVRRVEWRGDFSKIENFAHIVVHWALNTR